LTPALLLLPLVVVVVVLQAFIMFLLVAVCMSEWGGGGGGGWPWSGHQEGAALLVTRGVHVGSKRLVAAAGQART
jgi:hypothetical protein